MVDDQGNPINMFETTAFQAPEMYSSGKLSYTALFDMSGFFSEQARRALEGDDEMASRLFAESCQQQSMVLPTTAYQPYQQVFFESGYYQVPYIPSSFDSANVSPVSPMSPVSPISPVYNSSSISSNNNTFPQQVAVQRYAPSTDMPSRPMPVPSFQAVPRLSYPRRHSHHNQYHIQKRNNNNNNNHSRPFPPSPSITSESNLDNLSDCGVRSANGTWRCAHPGCSSKTVFTRACDLRKHYNRHRKYLFCRFNGCPQAREGGFSSKKDRARHEAKHNPQITCEWQGCGRVFSRADNMKDHVRRIHCRGR